jgi:amino acid efflux transporter
VAAIDSRVGAVRGTALFVASIIGPGILTLPALAAGQAGPASLVTLGVLLAISAPIAFTFAALHGAVPMGNGIAGYAAAAFGPLSGRLVRAWFLFGVPIGVPALGLIGGQYVAEVAGGGKTTVVAVAAGISAVAIVTCIMYRAGSGALTVLLSIALVLLITAAAVLALPHGDVGNLTPFAPRGVLAAAAAGLVLTWVLTGWEAVTNFTHVLRDPARTLPRVTAATLIIVALLYAAVAIPEILVLGPTAGSSEAPVAAMLRIAVGPLGAIIAAVLAVTIATGNSLAYVGSIAELGLTTNPSAVVDTGPRRARLRALSIPIVIIIAGLAAATFTPISIGELVSLCAGSQVPVYILGLAAGIKLFPALSRHWWLSLTSTVAVSILLIPAGLYLSVPAVIAVFVIADFFVTRRATHR